MFLRAFNPYALCPNTVYEMQTCRTKVKIIIISRINQRRISAPVKNIYMLHFELFRRLQPTFWQERITCLTYIQRHNQGEWGDSYKILKDGSIHVVSSPK